MNNEDFEKLNNCVEVTGMEIVRGDHFLYTSTKFKEEGRKCVYAVCLGASKGKITCNTYVPKGEEKALEDWVLTVTDKWKQYRFYKRNEEPKEPKEPKKPRAKFIKVEGQTRPKKVVEPIEPEIEVEEEEEIEEVVVPKVTKKVKVVKRKE